jgi:hypothetical protein
VEAGVESKALRLIGAHVMQLETHLVDNVKLLHTHKQGHALQAVHVLHLNLEVHNNVETAVQQKQLAIPQ